MTLGALSSLALLPLSRRGIARPHVLGDPPHGSCLHPHQCLVPRKSLVSTLTGKSEKKKHRTMLLGFTQPPSQPPRGHSPRGDERERRERSRSRHEKKKKKKRGGKKHQRLWRTLERPDLPVHRKQPAGFWEDTPSRRGREALERRR